MHFLLRCDFFYFLQKAVLETIVCWNEKCLDQRAKEIEAIYTIEQEDYDIKIKDWIKRTFSSVFSSVDNTIRYGLKRDCELSLEDINKIG